MSPVVPPEPSLEHIALRGCLPAHPGHDPAGQGVAAVRPIRDETRART